MDTEILLEKSQNCFNLIYLSQMTLFFVFSKYYYFTYFLLGERLYFTSRASHASNNVTRHILRTSQVTPRQRDPIYSTNISSHEYLKSVWPMFKTDQILNNCPDTYNNVYI